nr:hypothetical protein Iba_chr05eCG11270 [Ipomoea batatas]GME21155.1 hypothetical protein Iba_scaffold26974CG0010 [Ipomoea batatas]
MEAHCFDVVVQSCSPEGRRKQGTPSRSRCVRSAAAQPVICSPLPQLPTAEERLPRQRWRSPMKIQTSPYVLSRRREEGEGLMAAVDGRLWRVRCSHEGEGVDDGIGGKRSTIGKIVLA